MTEQWQIVKEQQARIEALEARIVEHLAERDRYAAELHTRNGELLVARMNLDMLRDDIKRAIALLPHDPGGALAVLVSALRQAQDSTVHAQSAPQAAHAGPSEAIGA